MDPAKEPVRADDARDAAVNTTPTTDTDDGADLPPISTFL